MKLKHIRLVKYAVAIGVLIALIAIFALLRLNENVSEYFFSRGISRGFVYVLGHINEAFNFSVFGVFCVLGIVVLVTCIVLIAVLFKKHLRTEAVALLERTVIAALSVALIYIATAGGCYNRKELPLDKYMGEQLTAEQTADILLWYYADFSEISDSLTYIDGKSVCPYTFDELADLLVEEYKRIGGGYFSPYTPRIKKALTSGLMSYGGTTGITFQPLGEAVINAETPDCYLVLTAAHELAHAKGVMRERDANLLAYYLLITSENTYLRYCGYMYSLRYLSSTLFVLNEELYREVEGFYPQKALIDRIKENEYWMEKEGFLNEISDFFNNIYLKLSGLSEGTANYGDPSEVTKVPEISEDEVVITVKITYSDTARVLIQNVLGR